MMMIILLGVALAIGIYFYVQKSKTKTKEDYILWLKLAKKTNFIGINKTLSSWRKSNNSLSSNTLQKVIDAFKVYFIYERYNFFISIIYTIRLSLNFLLKHYLNLNIRI